jgi:hypothetical protein
MSGANIGRRFVVRRLIWLALVITLLSFAVTRASAQMPDVIPTPEPTKLAEPSPTPTATPIVAALDEIVFTGELQVPAGTHVVANFYTVLTADLSDITCATTTTEDTDQPAISRFVLRVPTACAEERALKGICWADQRCLVNLAESPYCSPFGCEWSTTIRPGAVVDLGFIPVGSEGEIVFVGEIPAPPGTTVTIQVLDVPTVTAVTCDTTESFGIDEALVSSFDLRIAAHCSPRISFPRICWGVDLCQVLYEYDPRFNIFVHGTTVLAGLLNDDRLDAQPNPPSTGGGGPFLPEVGAGEGDGPAVAVTTLAIALLASSGCIAAGVGLIVARRRREREVRLLG